MRKRLGFAIAFFFMIGMGSTIAGAEGNTSRLENFVSELKAKRLPLQKAPEGETVQAPVVVVHFLWASWCEYCDRAYAQLRTFALEKKFAGKVSVVGYDLDDEMSPAVRGKLKEMPALEHYQAAPKSLKVPDELKRLPAMIVENPAKHQVEAYTGFTNERFGYMKKQILRILANAEDDNAE